MHINGAAEQLNCTFNVVKHSHLSTLERPQLQYCFTMLKAWYAHLVALQQHTQHSIFPPMLGFGGMCRWRGGEWLEKSLSTCERAHRERGEREMHSFSMFFVDDRRFSAASLSLLFLSLRSCRITWKHMNSASMCKRFFKDYPASCLEAYLLRGRKQNQKTMAKVNYSVVTVKDLSRPVCGVGSSHL